MGMGPGLRLHNQYGSFSFVQAEDQVSERLVGRHLSEVNHERWSRVSDGFTQADAIGSKGHKHFDH